MENKWIFAFADNGIGIKPEHQKQIFEIFKRLPIIERIIHNQVLEFQLPKKS
jgi:light-regulated signal transduction histidine kinase (bacteriophytochrome)